MATDNKTLVRQLTEEVWNNGNVDQVDELAATNLVSHLPVAQALVTTAAALPPGLPAERVVWVAAGRLDAFWELSLANTRTKFPLS